jgi:hypothetical protein
MGGISPTLGNYSHLNTLDLSMNLFTWLVSNTFGELNSPIVLDLSYNALTSEIPSILNQLPLDNLDVSYNNLYGLLPLGLLAVTYAKGNPNLCDMANNCEANGQQTSNTSKRVMVSTMVGTFVAIMIIFIVGSCYCLLKVYKIQRVVQGVFT